MSDRKDDLADRLGDRFDRDDDGEGETETNSNNAKKAKNAMSAKNVKQEWNATSIYLPDFLNRRLTTTYKRADLGYEEEFDTSLQKTRYYYPLVVSLGLEQLEGMDAQELNERIEALEQEAENE